MRKVWIIAVREYLAAVRTKAFIISLSLMPVLMGGSIVMQIIFKKIEDGRALCGVGQSRREKKPI